MPGPLSRYVEVLEVISQSSTGLSVADVCALTDLHKATVSRLLKALLDVDLLAQNPDPRQPYTIGTRLMSLVRNALSARLAGGAFSKELERLSNASQLTTMLAKLSDGSVNIISLSFPTDPVGPYVHPGAYERPILTCSLARAILAYQEDSFIQNIIRIENGDENAAEGPLARETNDKLKVVRDTGASICDEELKAGITSVAVPIQIVPYGTVASVGLVGFTADIKKNPISKYIDELNVTKGEIEKKIEVFGNGQEWEDFVNLAWKGR